MFPSIDNVSGVNAVRRALETRDLKHPSTECLIEALDICLHHNNSTFAGQHLIQTNGTAMGAANSCSYSDLAIYPIDQKILHAQANSLNELFYFGRYRDDCITLWTGKIERLNDFLNFINGIDTNIQFTIEIGYNELNFLDLKMNMDSNNVLSKTIYSKPTESHLHLP